MNLNLPYPFESAEGLTPDAEGRVALVDGSGKVLAHLPVTTAHGLSIGSDGSGFGYGCSNGAGYGSDFGYSNGAGYGAGDRYGDGYDSGHGYGSESGKGNP